MNIERSLALDQDCRHNVPSSKPATKQCGGATSCPWHRQTIEQAKVPKYKEGLKLGQESRYKMQEAQELLADSADRMKCSAAGLGAGARL